MNGNRFRYFLAAIALIVSGCAARPPGEIFPQIDPPVVFPPPPDTARIRYVGSLSTDRDLKPGVSGWQRFKRAVKGPTPARSISAPSGLAVSSAERLYVTDPPLRCLHVFDLAARRYRAIFDAGGIPLSVPADVAVAEGRVYLTDAGRAAIHVYTESGDFVTSWTGLNLTRPVGIAFDEETRRLYVVDAGKHQCVGYSLDGKERVRFGRRGTEPGALNFPTFVTCHPNLGIIVSDSLNFRVQRFDPDGRLTGGFGQKGDAAGDFALPKGVAVDAREYIYVADAHFENIQVFDPEGKLMMAFGGEGQAPGRFWLPAKIVIDAKQRLWIADTYNRRIQVFQLLREAPV